MACLLELRLIGPAGADHLLAETAAAWQGTV